MKLLTNIAKYCVAVTVLVLASSIVFGGYFHGAICTSCGRTRSTADTQIPGTSVTLWSRTSDSDSSLSVALRELNLIPGNHQHTWAFTHGSGNGVTCAIGRGGDVLMAARNCGPFVRAIHAVRGPAIAERWVAVLLDPERSSAATMIACAVAAPGTPLATPAEIEQAIQKAAPLAAILDDDSKVFQDLIDETFHPKL